MLYVIFNIDENKNLVKDLFDYEYQQYTRIYREV